MQGSPLRLTSGCFGYKNLRKKSNRFLLVPVCRYNVPRNLRTNFQAPTLFWACGWGRGLGQTRLIEAQSQKFRVKAVRFGVKGGLGFRVG